MTDARTLRLTAEAEVSHLPPLLARAEQLAGTVLLGEHGRRRAGIGDDFWQYRPFHTGDSRRMIDWRRSARSDAEYVREREWQVAQSVMLWVDASASMRFKSADALPEKSDRARLITLAASILLIKGGERVGLSGNDLPPQRGRAQIMRLAEHFTHNADTEYGTPEARAMLPHACALFVSDFMGDVEPVKAALAKAADRGVRGVLMQVLDPAEENFPFQGRTIFESAGKSLRYETLKAYDLKAMYLDKLAQRKEELRHLCTVAGWQFATHHTDAAAQTALLWLHRALERPA